jgi:hypothetical protein
MMSLNHSNPPGEKNMIRKRPIPIYTTKGDWFALLHSPYIYNTRGEWIGWIVETNDVFDVEGVYVGWLSDEKRILRKRSKNKYERRTPPNPPDRIRAPATIPLPPLMRELPYGVIDVLEEEPNRLHTIDSGEFKEDMN